MSFFKRIFSSEKKETLDKGLEKSKTTFFSKLSKAVAGKSKVDDEVLDNLEEILVSSDVGVNTTLKIITRIENRVASDKYLGTDELNEILREEIAGLLSETNSGEATEFVIPIQTRPYVLMVVGVNGVGKTTTIGKLAHQFKSQGLNVVLGAADTFRAAAVDQLQTWGARIGVDVIVGKNQSEPASVAFDAATFAKQNNREVLIVDTAGRLHIDEVLMDEIQSVRDIAEPRETLLVVDGLTGQDAVNVATEFDGKVGITGVVLTRMDGDGRGGAALSMRAVTGKPIRFVGMGEKMDALVQVELAAVNTAPANSFGWYIFAGHSIDGGTTEGTNQFTVAASGSNTINKFTSPALSAGVRAASRSLTSPLRDAGSPNTSRPARPRTRWCQSSGRRCPRCCCC